MLVQRGNNLFSRFFYLYENHKNGHFSILVDLGCSLPFHVVLESHYLEKGGQHDEYQDSRWLPTDKNCV